MLHRPAVLAPLSRFVLEVLPWGLSGLIALYLIWGVWSAVDSMPAGSRPLAAHATSIIDQAL